MDKKFLVFSVIFIFLVFSVLRVGILGITQVDVNVSNAGCTTSEGIKLSSSLVGNNFFLIDEGRVSEKILEKYPCVGMVRLEREFPKVVKLTVEGRTPFARIATFKQTPLLGLNNLEATPSSQSALIDWSSPQPTSEQFVVDNNGVVFGANTKMSLPMLFIPNIDIKVGQRLDNNLFHGIYSIFGKLNQLDIPVSEAKMVGTDLLVREPQEIAFSLKKDVDRQLISLQLILQKAKIDERRMETIDLRFDKPVVKYVPKKNN